ncbi:MAG: PDZ domain-containing protein [Actinomycetota bacterium]|nr:PDZ domain-containing protein [Actinomycetota bacterium]
MNDSYLRFPHVNGDLVTFVAETEVWLAPLEGGSARRLSHDGSQVAHPRLSSDGSQVAWTSRAYGAPEVLVAPLDGGPAQRLTYWGAQGTGVRGWLPDGRVVAVSDAGQGSARRVWAHALPVDGSPSERLPWGLVGEFALGTSGEVLVSTPVMGAEPAWRKRYRGGTAARLWIDRAGDGEFARLLPEHTASLVHPCFLDGRTLVVSDHEGSSRIYELVGDASLRELAGHDFYVRHATSDGGHLVYVSAGDLWVADEGILDGEDPRRVEVALTSARPARQSLSVPAGEALGELSVDGTGRASALEVRGQVHWVTHREGPARALVARPGVRARAPVVVDDDRVAVVTDDGGEDGIEVHRLRAEAGEDPVTWARGELGRVLEMVAAPDASTLAVAAHDGRLLLVDLAESPSGRRVREVDRAHDGEVTGLAFSPDSAWLAWSHPGPDPLRQLRITRVADGPEAPVVEATPLRFADTDPVFTADGKHLAFLSVRSLEPVYDAYVFDLGFPVGSRPHLLPLGARTPSPFDAQVDGRPPTAPADDRHDEADPGSTPAVTEVDSEGLHERAVPFPVPPARYESLQVVQGGLVWLRGEASGALPALGTHEAPRAALERFDLGTCRCEVLVDAVAAVWVSADGSHLVVRDDKDLRVLPATRKVPDGPEGEQHRVEVDLSRVRVRVDRLAEWRQGYDEAGRLMRDNFWRADLGGADWGVVLDRYRPLLERLGGHDDFVDLLWEVQGELATSHAYVQSPPGKPDPLTRLGLLGADLARDPDGTWRIARVVPGESSDPLARSPLSAPGVGMRAGDAILAVDGLPVPAEQGPAALLVGGADHPVELAVRSADGETRRVVVTPLSDEIPLRYQDWVAQRRAYVREQSQGRLGYLHVPDMIATGWAQLHRDLRVEMGHEGVVVDLRENRGGHTSELVIEKLARRVVGWIRSRGYRPQRYPSDAPRGPVVAVADEFSGSDGDIVNAAIQALGIGPVVGVRTWGGVVGIDGKYQLADGTRVTQPRYAFWLEGKGWDVENHGVDPDVEVVTTPQDRTAGRDPQLDTAIRLALESLTEQPAAAAPEVPDLSGR